MNVLSIIVVPYNRIKHLIKEAKRIRQLELTIETIRQQHQNAVDKGMVHYAAIYNVSLYLLIFEYDIAILKNDALFSIRRWKKGFVARQLAVLLYEASQDLPKLLGKDFRSTLREVGISKSELEKFDAISKSINQFKNDHRKILQKLRNYSGAHRHNDAATQLNVIEDVSLFDIMELTGDFYVPIRELTSFMTNLIIKLGDWKVLIKHTKIPKTAE